MWNQNVQMSSKDSRNLLPEAWSKAPRIVPAQNTAQNLKKAKSLESYDESVTECDCEEVKYGAGDAVLSTFVVAPLVVGVWRGTWGILDSHGKAFPYAQTYLLGMLIHICFALIRSQLLSRSKGAWSAPRGGYCRWLRERFISRVYTYIFILSCIMHWRGGWGLFDATVEAILPDPDDPHRPVLIAAFTIACYLSAAFLRSSRNILATPYFLFTDGKEATYIFTTRFNKTVSA